MHETLRQRLARLISRLFSRKAFNSTNKLQENDGDRDCSDSHIYLTHGLLQESKRAKDGHSDVSSVETRNPMELNRALLEKHPQRGILALLAAIKHQKSGNIPSTKEYLILACKWGCDSESIKQLMLSTAYESVAKASALAGRQELAIRQRTEAMSLIKATKLKLSNTHPELFREIEGSGLLPTEAGDQSEQMLPFKNGSVPSKETTEHNESLVLHDLLRLARPIEIVDIGANPIDGPTPYAPLLNLGICKITGFEPNDKALAKLNRTKGEHETYSPNVIGDGQSQFINFYKASGMTSLLEIDEKKVDLFKFFVPLCETKSRISIKTHRIDDLPEIGKVDFLKIDIQGGELMALKSGAKKLNSAVAIQTEVSFVTLYKDQPAIGNIDVYLRSQGFIPHCFAAIKHWPLSPYMRKGSPKTPLNQLLEADIIYIKDISKDELFCDEQLKHLALIAHHCYGSYDLALKCIELLAKRSAVEPATLDVYKRLVFSD